MHHPRADIEHLKIKKENGRDLIQAELTYKNNYYRIKEILQHYNKLDATVCKWETKEKVFSWWRK